VTVAHNLGEEFVIVQLYRRESNDWVGELGVMVRAIDENTIILRGCYGVGRAVKARWSMSTTKATRCNPANVSDNRS